jgi:hypothetical protein
MKDWQAEWDPMIAAVGTDFARESTRAGADSVERGSIRRYLEPLEFDCPLHYDDDVARAHGYEATIAPYSSLFSFTAAPLWAPGGAPVFSSSERDAQLARPSMSNMGVPAPPTTASFATDIEIQYFAPIRLGDHLVSRGRRLVACVPKETSVGKGAFSTWESEVHNQDGQLVAKVRTGSYNYYPNGVRDNE